MPATSAQTEKDRQYWKILDAVIRLEVVKGHLRWKVTELARLSGVGRPLIYYYFGKSKKSIVETAMKIIGDEFFGLSPERLALWKAGQIMESVSSTRELLTRAPHMAEFYFHWRHQKGEISDYFQELEKRYLTKLAQLMPQLSPVEIQAVFAIFFGLILLPDLNEESLRVVVEKMRL